MPVRIGHVVAVSGPHAVALLERSTDLASRDKDPRIQIGAIVKITTPVTSVVGQVSAVSAPMPELDGKKEEIGLIEINIAGEIGLDDKSIKPVFRRGVSALPSLGDPVHLADRNDLALLYALSGVSSIKVGT